MKLILQNAQRNRYARPMKTQKMRHSVALLALILTSTQAFAHCPSSYKEEKVCFMLEKNLLYIYDNKLEHNGPHKDFEKADLVALKSPQGQKLDFKKVARGIYKIESAEILKNITVEVSLDKKKNDIKVAHE